LNDAEKKGGGRVRSTTAIYARLGGSAEGFYGVLEELGEKLLLGSSSTQLRAVESKLLDPIV
jgi:hypothetical protein